MRRGKQHKFLRRKMKSDFTLKKLHDFRLPCRQIGVADGRRTIDTNTQGQNMLVLARKRN